MLAAMVICLMLASGQGAHVLLEKLSDQHVHCSWGAQFWCSSVATAAACGKTDWCTKNHWPYDELQDVPCTVMQQLVTNIRTLARTSIHSFLTHDEIAVFIVKGCALLPDGEPRNQCKQLITDEDILFKLLSLVGSDLSVQSVATAVGVCKKNTPTEKESAVACGGLKPCDSSIQNVIKGGTEEQVEGAGPVCFICRLVMKQLESLLAKNSTEKHIEAALQKVCSFFPSFIRQKCAVFVSKYTPRLVQLLLRYPPQLVCSVVGLCSDTVGASVSNVQQSPNMKDTGCFLCKLVIDQVKSMLSEHTTQDEIKAALEKVCHLLPPIVESVCDTLVEKYEPQLIQMLLSSLTSEEICEKLNLCTDGQASVSNVQQSPNMKDTGCFICKLVIDQVKSMLSEHTTQDEIKAALEKVCHLLPPIVESVCDTLVEKYEPQLIQMLLSSLTSEEICEKLNLCTDGQDEIKAALEKVCHLLPPIVESVCDTFVETYEPQLIQMLLSSLTSEEICEKLNLCTDVQASVSNVQQSPNVKDTGCFLCKLVIDQVKSMLSEHTTQDEIKAALEKVCHLLSPIFESVCDTFVEKYEPQLIQMLLSSLTSEEICEKLNLCTGGQVSDKSQLLMFIPEKNAQPATLLDKERCSTCLTTLYNFQSTLNQPNWQTESRAVLQQLCSDIKNDQGLCKLLVDASVSGMIRYLQNSPSPAELCQKAGFCGPSEFVPGDEVHSKIGRTSATLK